MGGDRRQKGLVTMTNKLTIKEQYAQVLEVLEAADKPALVDFIKGRVAILEKKNASGERKPTKEQIANEAIRQNIVDSMEPNKMYTLSQLAELVEELNGSSSQRMVGLMRPITNDPDKGVTDRAVNKVMDKRKAYYTLA